MIKKMNFPVYFGKLFRFILEIYKRFKITFFKIYENYKTTTPLQIITNIPLFLTWLK